MSNNNNKGSDLNMIEYYNKQGLMRDRYYNQLNGKSRMENYTEAIRRRQQQESKDYESIILQNLQESIKSAVDAIIEDVLR